MLPNREQPVQSVIIGGRHIAYEHMGRGEPIVLVHGFLSDSRAWRPQFEPLAREFRVIAWDAPGCGQSDDPPETFGFAEYADCLAALLDSLAITSAHMVGLSWGGACLLEFWRRHPEKVRTLTISGGYAGWKGSLPEDVVAERLARANRDAAQPPDTWVDTFVPGLFGESASDEMKQEARAMLADYHPAGYLAMARGLAESDLRDVLPTIAVPTLLLWGGSDQRSPVVVGESFQEAVPGSEMIVIPGAGHLLNVDAAETFTGHLLDFVRRNSAR